MNNVILIGGTRPNFVKLAPLARALRVADIDFTVVNTGQHFDPEMSTDFLQEFSLVVDYSLTPVREPAVAQFADIMTKLETIFTKVKPELVVVVGDVNSTLAAALTAYKMHIPLAHVEAGLRSGNFEMPEETNRIITDFLSDYLFVPSHDAEENLQRESIRGDSAIVGNIMIDNLYFFADQIPATSEKFYFCTLHRTENVDHEQIFSDILAGIERIQHEENVKIYMPVHPRTKNKIKEFGLEDRCRSIFEMIEPVGYKQSLSYIKNAQMVLTDSGGIQEEASALGTPCLTLRTETERPITVSLGTNVIGGITPESIMSAYSAMNKNKRSVSIPLWDGKTAGRIVSYIQSL